MIPLCVNCEYFIKRQYGAPRCARGSETSPVDGTMQFKYASVMRIGSECGPDGDLFKPFTPAKPHKRWWQW